MTLAVLLGVGACASQDPAAGIEAFATRRFGVDLATSNLNLMVPVRSTSGAAFNLVLNNHIFPFSGEIHTNSLISLSTGTLWDAQLTFITRTITCHTDRNDTEFTGFAIIDSTGARHSLSTAIKSDNDGCFTLPASATTLDGQYTVLLTGVNSFAAIYAPSGMKISNVGLTDTDQNVILQGVAGGSYVGPLSSTPELTVPLGSGGSQQYQYTDASGATRAVITSSTNYYTWTAFGCSSISGIFDENGTTQSYYPTSIALPDGSSYQIAYEQSPGKGVGYITGRIAKITLPTGGSVSYTYLQGSDPNGNNGVDCKSWVVPKLQVTVNDNRGNVATWTYINSNTSSTPANFTVGETDPAGNTTTHYFSGTFETERIVKDASFNLLSTTVTCYNGSNATQAGCVSPSPVIVSLGATQTDVYTTVGSLTSLVETKYASGLVTEVKRFDFGATYPPSGTPAADMVIAYNTGSTCGTLNQYILDRPCSVTNTGPSGQASQTNYTYNSTGHALITSRWVGAGAQNLTASSTYNNNGTINVATDTNGTTSTYSYNGSCNNLLPTGVTISGTNVSLSRSMTWDCNGAVRTSLTDENGNVTATKFTVSGVADPFYRPLSLVDPMMNTTGFEYPSSTTSESVMNFNGTVSTSDTLSTLDGLARTIFKQMRQGQGSSNFDSTQSGFGWTTTGPFTTQSVAYSGTQGQNAPTGTAITTLQYDGLNRLVHVTDGGGGTVSYSYISNDVLQTIGPTQTFQKQLE